MFKISIQKSWKLLFVFLMLIATPMAAFANEANLMLPDLSASSFGAINWSNLLSIWIIIALLGICFGMRQFFRIKKMAVHSAMANISDIIYETCKTYLLQQWKFLVILFLITAVVMFYYFFGLSNMPVQKVLIILLWTILGVLWSYGIARFGIRINTFANSRTAFASLEGKPWSVVSLPLKAGMSIWVVLVCVEIILMLVILLFMPKEVAGACLIGFAIGESLAASALRIAGWIFTKIADIGADLMKIVFKLGEDDPRNPGVIADCTGDNAGDSVGPTADGFETYGVTLVALLSFIILAMKSAFQSTLIVWIFVMAILMIFTAIFSYQLNQIYSKFAYRNNKKFNFENPLTRLIWIGCIVSIGVTFVVSYFLLSNLAMGDGVINTQIRWQLASIISIGTLGAAIIPELTKAFTSSNSRHVAQIVTATREGGAGLNVLSGIVAGNFSAFWKGFAFVVLMAGAYYISTLGLGSIVEYQSIFAFGLVAFGFLSLGPITIAVDSYGPVTDNAQSVFELSQIESIKGIESNIEKNFGFTPSFEIGKDLLEANDSAGNTFKATTKPVLIWTAVIGATTMIFAIILLLKASGLLHLQLTDAPVIFGLMMWGAVVYRFSWASIQAVTTWAYRAVAFIKKNLNLNKKTADIEDSKTVVRICTQFAQKGMWNIFAVIFSLTLAFAFFDPNFFVAYLISIAIFGLFQAMFMANAGGARDNAKKFVEVDLKEKGTELHSNTVVGDIVGDPYKDTSSVALNPIIKFSTLFGLLAVEIAISMSQAATKNGTFNYSRIIGGIFLLIGLIFVYRSFYGMRIEKN